MRVEQDKMGAVERKIVIGTIVDDRVCSTVSARYSKHMGQSKFGNLVLGWCADYFRKHKKAPGRHIEDRYAEWVEEGGKDKETVKAVGSFLSSLSGQWKRTKKGLNAGYIIDMASGLFNRVGVEKLMEDCKRSLDNGDVAKAWAKIEKARRVEMGQSSGVQVFKDDSALDRLMAVESEPPLVTYPGALGHFYGRSLSRGKFVGFEGPEKRGKSFFIYDVGWVGMEQEKKVLFMSIGDMTETEVMERLYARACGRPLLPTEDHFPMKMPTHLEPGGDSVTHKDYKFKKALTKKRIKKLTKKVTEKWNDLNLMELYTCPNFSINIMQVKDYIARRADEGQVFDIIIMDYLELLAPSQGFIDTREQIDANWKHARGISQEYDNLFITAAQTDADSYSATTITMKNFSGSKTKNAHVSAMIGINQTEAEKEQGLYRLNYVGRRSGKYSSDKFVYTAACLDVANPCVLSTF